MWSKALLPALLLLSLASAPVFGTPDISPKEKLISELLMLETQLNSLQAQIKTSESLISDLKTQLENSGQALDEQTELLAGYERQYQEQIALYQELLKRSAELEQSLRAYQGREIILIGGCIVVTVVAIIEGLVIIIKK